MQDESTCVRCGGPLPAGYESRRPCPRCLLEFAAGTPQGTGEPEPSGEPAPTPEEIAADFPQLEIIELLGEGGMGVVFRARQRDLGRDVALKILRPRFSEEASFVERFLREARALAQLSHPGIVTVYECGRAGEHLYLLMELVEGTNLRKLIHAGELKPPQALEVVSQVCAALQYAHEQCIVHRDIKPENILVDREGRVKIADFGLAKMARACYPEGSSRLTRSSQAMGTPQYMAPEQIEHPLEVDHRADIYSLGVVFYELLTGELPLGRFAPPSRKVEVDVRLDEVVLKSLEKEPERRYQHASEVRTGIEDIQESSKKGGSVMAACRSCCDDVKSRGGCWWLGAIALMLGACVFLPLTCMGVGALFLTAAPVMIDESQSEQGGIAPIEVKIDSEPEEASLFEEDLDPSYEERVREAVDKALQEPPAEEPEPPTEDAPPDEGTR